MKKSSFINYLPILAGMIAIVCICMFTACEKEPSEKELGPYDTPSGFDQKKDGASYGTLEEKTYFSSTTGANRKCWVYTPPGYDPSITYPVLYLLHGIGGTHNEWKEGGNPNEILSNLINSGSAKPMIAVMPNIRAMNPDGLPPDQFAPNVIAAFHNFKNDLKNNLMPFIKTNYSVSDDRDKCAVAGLSMGGMESIHIMVTMPELFGYVGAFSASPGLPTELTPDKMTLPDDFKDKTFILGCCGTKDTTALETSKSYNKQLEDNGITTTYYTIPDGYHGFDVWKNGLYNFAKRIF
ncbi:MAG: esterase family protein [Treponema sp.]|nr:esterase family protein [Treponema sp.]